MGTCYITMHISSATIQFTICTVLLSTKKYWTLQSTTVSFMCFKKRLFKKICHYFQELSKCLIGFCDHKAASIAYSPLVFWSQITFFPWKNTLRPDPPANPFCVKIGKRCLEIRLYHENYNKQQFKIIFLWKYRSFWTFFV